MSRIVKNMFWLLMSDIGEKILSFLLVVLVTRNLGSVGYGKYSFAFAFVIFFTILASMGLTTYLLKEVSKLKGKQGKISLLAGEVCTLSMLLSSGFLAAGFLIALLVVKDPQMKMVMLLASVQEIATAGQGLIRALVIAYERNELKALFAILEKGLPLAFAAISFFLGKGLVGLFVALTIGKALSLAINGVLMTTRCVRITPSFSWDRAKDIIRKGFPFWLSIVFITLYYQVDRIMLTAMRGYETTGIYSAASTIIASLIFVPLIFVHAAFPSMSRQHHQMERERLQGVHARIVRAVVGLAVPMTVGLIILAPRIVLFVYGEGFLPSAALLRILSGVLILLYLNYLMGYLLNAVDRQKQYSIANITSTTLNVAANAVLIPFLAAEGAAYATILSQGVAFTLLLRYTKKTGYETPIIKEGVKPLISAIGMGAVLLWLGAYTLFIVVPIGVAVYACLLVVMKGIDKGELMFLKKSFLRRR